MDFSKAFDKVPHRRLNYKLHWYGIRELRYNGLQPSSPTERRELSWRELHLAPAASYLECPRALSWGLFFSLYYINDLPDGVVNSTARLFADDCIVYRSIRNVHDAILLQNDLNSIAEWELTWEMKFNIDKCFIMRSGRVRQKIIHQYTLHDQPLVETETAKYLGITLTPDLKINGTSTSITSPTKQIVCLASSAET